MKTLSLVFVFLCGCATSYQPSGFGGGFTESRLAPDVFRISFRGNAYTSDERAQDFALLRAGELATQNNFPWFAVVDERVSHSVQVVSNPTYSYTSGSATRFGNYVDYSEHSVSAGGGVSVMTKPRSGLLVQCFKTRPDGIYTFDAWFLQTSIRQKYNLSPPLDLRAIETP